MTPKKRSFFVKLEGKGSTQGKLLGGWGHYRAHLLLMIFHEITMFFRYHMAIFNVHNNDAPPSPPCNDYTWADPNSPPLNLGKQLRSEV